MGGFFGEDCFVSFGAFVFFKFAVLFYYPGVVHGDKGVFAVLAIDDAPPFQFRLCLSRPVFHLT